MRNVSKNTRIKRIKIIIFKINIFRREFKANIKKEFVKKMIYRNFKKFIIVNIKINDD